MNARVSELRMEYLFSLAHLCHVSPSDPITVRDFFGLVLGIDAYIEAQKRAREEHG